MSLNPVTDKTKSCIPKSRLWILSRYFLDGQMGSPEVGTSFTNAMPTTTPIFPSLLDNSVVPTHAQVQVFHFFL